MDISYCNDSKSGSECKISFALVDLQRVTRLADAAASSRFASTASSVPPSAVVLNLEDSMLERPRIIPSIVRGVHFRQSTDWLALLIARAFRAAYPSGCDSTCYGCPPVFRLRP